MLGTLLSNAKETDRWTSGRVNGFNGQRLVEREGWGHGGRVGRTGANTTGPVVPHNKRNGGHRSPPLPNKKRSAKRKRHNNGFHNKRRRGQHSYGNRGPAGRSYDPSFRHSTFSSSSGGGQRPAYSPSPYHGTAPGYGYKQMSPAYSVSPPTYGGAASSSTYTPYYGNGYLPQNGYAAGYNASNQNNTAMPLSYTPTPPSDPYDVSPNCVQWHTSPTSPPYSPCSSLFRSPHSNTTPASVSANNITINKNGQNKPLPSTMSKLKKEYAMTMLKLKFDETMKNYRKHTVSAPVEYDPCNPAYTHGMIGKDQPSNNAKEYDPEHPSYYY